MSLHARTIHLVGGPLHNQAIAYDGKDVGKIEFDVEGTIVVYQIDSYIDPWVASFFSWGPTNEELAEKLKPGQPIKHKQVVPA